MNFELRYFFPRLKLNIQMAWWNFKARCQRFIRGYSYSDVWNMDQWFRETVKPMLIHLRDHGCGIPGDLYQEGENERANWEAVLTEMVDCLTLMEENNVYKHLFGENWFEQDLFDRDTILANWELVNSVMDKNKNRFFELFSKYFYHLWD